MSMRVWIGYDDKGKVVKVTTSIETMYKYFHSHEVRTAEQFDVELEEVNLDDDDLLLKGGV